MASSPQIFAPNQNTLPKTIPAIETCKWYFFAVLTLAVCAWVSPQHLSDKSGAFSCTLHLFLRVFWWNVCCRAAVEVQLKYCHCCHLLHPASACIIQTGELHKAAKLYFTLLACFSAYILFFCVFFIRWYVLEPELHIITTFCAWAYYMHACAPAVYIALATPVTTADTFIRWSCQDVSSDAARGKKKSLTALNFLGCGSAFKCLNMPGNSIHHIQSAHKQCKEKAETMTQPKGCLTDIFRSAVDREQCGLTTSFTEKILKKSTLKWHL